MMNPEDTVPTAGPDTPEGGQSPGRPPGLWRRLASLLWSTGIFHPEEWPVRKLLRQAMVLAVVLVAIGILRHGIAHVREDQVGVKINNLSGEITLQERVGYHVFVPYLTSFHALDKIIQRVDLAWAQRPGGASRDVKIKTADGSNVSMDVSITFKMIPQEAVKVLRRSGTGRRFAETWIEPFARHVCFDSFGRLTTEEMYDATLRNEKAQEALRQLNESLGPHGIEIIAVIPGDVRFYAEYEDVIRQKKEADQQVEEQRAVARALLEERERQLVEVRKRTEARLAAMKAETARRLIQEQAEADRARLEADGRYAGALLAADAALYSSEGKAKGRRETLLAEAEGLESLRKALGGDGGLTIVGLEYAKRLASVRFSGTPITRDPAVKQFAVESAGGDAETTEPAAVLRPPAAAGGTPPTAPQRPAPQGRQP
jgi:hypothetical protein